MSPQALSPCYTLVLYTAAKENGSGEETWNGRFAAESSRETVAGKRAFAEAVL
jgi:hypothetical protein